MEEIARYISPELMILIPVLYLIGCGLKKAEFVLDKYIPSAIGLIGVILACLYVFAKNGLTLEGLFVSICQGILCAGASVYFNQMFKQLKK